MAWTWQMHTQKEVTLIFLCWIFQCSIKLHLACCPLPSSISTKHCTCTDACSHFTICTDSPAHFKVPQIGRAIGRAWLVWSGFRIITIPHALCIPQLQKGSSYPDLVFFFRVPSCLLQSVLLPRSGADLFRLLAGSESSPYHPAGRVLSFSAEGNAGRTHPALLSTACGQIRCYWGLTHQGMGCENGIWISVCITTLCCLIKKSELVISLGNPPSPPRILQCSGSLHEYWLVMHFWGYGYLWKWERLLHCMEKPEEQTVTAFPQNHTGTEISCSLEKLGQMGNIWSRKACFSLARLLKELVNWGNEKQCLTVLAESPPAVKEQDLAPKALPFPRSPLNDLIAGSPAPSALQP